MTFDFFSSNHPRSQRDLRCRLGLPVVAGANMVVVEGEGAFERSPLIVSLWKGCNSRPGC